MGGSLSLKRLTQTFTVPRHRCPASPKSVDPIEHIQVRFILKFDLYCGWPRKKAKPKQMQPFPFWSLNQLLIRNAPGTYLAGTALSVVFSLCLLGALPSLNAEPAQEKPSVPTGTQAPPFAPGKYPYRLAWGANTVVAEVEPGIVSDDNPHQPHQIRIVDASGHLLRRLEADRVEDVRLVKPLVASEQGLLVVTTGGNSGLEDYYGFGKGAANRFHVSDAIQVDVKDLNGDGTAEIIAIYRLSDIDGGGEHHGANVTVVYQWNGTKYVEATRTFPALTRAREKEDQSALAAIEAKASQNSASQDNAAPDASDSEIDGHFNAAVGYLINATIAGDGTEAQAWLKDNVRADRLQLTIDIKKSVSESVQSMLSPLAQDSGDDSQVSAPIPATANSTKTASKATQKPQRAGVVAGQSLGIIKIGAARADVIAAIKGRPTANYDLKHGLTEDVWNSDGSDGAQDYGAEGYYSVSVWYRQGKVVQAQTVLTNQQRGKSPSLNALIARDRALKEVCYSMSYYDPSGETRGGVDFYCFDDVKKGIAYGISVNGDAYMTDKPDTLIIHVAGVPYIPFQGLTNVSRLNGAMLYQNQAEADKAIALKQKIKALHTGAHKKH